MDVVDFFLENIRFETEFTQNLREIPEKLPRGTDEVLEKSLQTSWTFRRIWRAYCRFCWDTVQLLSWYVETPVLTADVLQGCLIVVFSNRAGADV